MIVLWAIAKLHLRLSKMPMNRFSPDSNPNASPPNSVYEVEQSPLGVPQKNETLHSVEDTAKASPKTVRQVKHIYIILLVIGLGLGILTAVGVIAVLEQFGLTEVPVEVEETPPQL